MNEEYIDERYTPIKNYTSIQRINNPKKEKIKIYGMRILKKINDIKKLLRKKI